MSGYRVAHRFDTRIDWQSPLFFEYDGAVHAGYAGDTLASALLAGGAGMLARSFKFGRPRGIVAAGPEEPNVLVQVEATPDLKATEVNGGRHTADAVIRLEHHGVVAVAHQLVRNRQPHWAGTQNCYTFSHIYHPNIKIQALYGHSAGH